MKDIDTQRAAVRRGTGAALALAAAALVALAAALPADAQAARTRPSEGASGGTVSGSSGGSGSGSSSGPSSGPSAQSAPSVPDTRPGASSGRQKITDDRRRGRHGGGDDRDVVVVNPWGWSYPYRWGWYWDPWMWGWYGGVPYGYYGPQGGYASRRSGPDMGALDLDLKPGDTQIWLDGQYIGIADRFDGWPGYLWLEDGDYEFVFYREGRRTIHREYRVRTGLVLDVEDRLEEGESTPPEQLFPPRPTPHRDARLRRNEEQRRAAEEAARAAPVERWEDMGADGRGDDDRDADEEMASDEPAAPGGALRLAVTPSDASVYLDGRFLGTGDDLAGLRRGLAVSAGEHVLEVVRPGHEPEVRRIDVGSGEDLEIEVVLRPR